MRLIYCDDSPMMLNTTDIAMLRVAVTLLHIVFLWRLLGIVELCTRPILVQKEKMNRLSLFIPNYWDLISWFGLFILNYWESYWFLDISLFGNSDVRSIEYKLQSQPLHCAFLYESHSKFTCVTSVYSLGVKCLCLFEGKLNSQCCKGIVIDGVVTISPAAQFLFTDLFNCATLQCWAISSCVPRSCVTRTE